MVLRQRIQFIIPVLWLGFVLSISFMEAWLKFQADGVTQIIGLNIGKLVFGVLNKVELFFIAVLFISTIKKQGLKINIKGRNLLILLLVILLAQTFYLLPALDQRAEMIINGKEPATSYLHLYYVLLELGKACLLCTFIHKTVSQHLNKPSINSINKH